MSTEIHNFTGRDFLTGSHTPQLVDTGPEEINENAPGPVLPNLISLVVGPKLLALPVAKQT